MLLQVQTITRAAEERRADRRQWHDEAVNVIVDVATLTLDAGVLALGLPVLSADGTPSDLNSEWAGLQERWMTELRRRLQRIARGHPDAGMRLEAVRVGDATIRALQVAFDSIRAPRERDEENLLRVFEMEITPAARSYVRCLHGGDEREDEQPVSTLRRIRDTYRESGIFLRPSEIS
ncbi:hypothetical protein ACQEVZ_44175 [Dactylosporangium sp. CA-152071]|uniref:hypothetical protein n=1 Tax=Dactylosporangium sp. CA-152071 TaxID=3239933 RepID=UPI003D8DEF79